MKLGKIFTLGIVSAAFVLTAAFAFQPQKAGTVYATETVAVDAQSVAQTSEQTVEQTAVQTTEQVTEQATEQVTEQTAEKTPEQLALEAEEARKALQNDPNHVHHFRWIAKMNESESAEGTINYMCPECGKIWYFRPLEAYYAFQGDVARRIELAPEGGTVNVKTSHYINFNKQVMKALEERQDVSVHVSFLDQEYKGNRVSFTIPAGEDVMALVDKNGYAGFLYLGGIYGLTLEEAAVIPETTTESEETANKEEQKDATKVITVIETTENGDVAYETVVDSEDKKNAE